MPKEDNAEIWENPGSLELNEIPKTCFIDEIDAIKVTLVSGPQKEDLYKLIKNVAYSSWGKTWRNIDIKEAIEFLKTAINKGTLPLSLEMNNFTFLFERLTRISTHAVVRSRVGVTYSQQSTGNSSQRHCDILVPRSLANPKNKKILDEYISWCLRSKIAYAHALDMGISVQESRIFLPSTNSNLIYVSFNLASLMNFYSKRIDCSEEYLQLNEVCRQIKNIFDTQYPEISPILQSACGKFCAHSKPSVFVNSVYRPCDADDKFSWNPKSFLYGEKTRDEMCWYNKPFETQYYIGIRKVSKEEFERDTNENI